MENQFSRTERLIGEASTEILKQAHVLVCGIGGVGGYVCEALARAGIGTITLVDNDRVSISNLNRQLIATHETVGQYKNDVMEARIHEICPETTVINRKCFFIPDNADTFDFSQYDYVVDAIDTVSGKIELIVRAKAAGVPVISAMGAGNKLDATAFRVADIAKTKVCPLARVMRYELKKRGITDVKVVYSEEAPHTVIPAEADAEATAEVHTKIAPGSVPFVPPVVGCIVAGEVIKDLVNNHL